MDEKDLPKRKHPRLKEFDYSQGGAYFITICVQNRKNVLAKFDYTNKEDVVGRGLAPAVKIQNTLYGQIVDNELKNIEARFQGVELGEYVIMPNHIHLILHISEAAGASPRPTIMDVICAFKSLATRKCKEIGYNGKLFQTSFYDRVIRNREEYMEICNYITLNPENWENDELYI